MAAELHNALVSCQQSSDTGLQVTLHPLPLIEISDSITRGYQRGHKGAIVGGLLGQQKGREITVEHSFSCKTNKNDSGQYELDVAWFGPRLEQMKAVHQNPPLDLVGWYALVPRTGPTPAHLPIHSQLLAQNEAAILLGFHIEDMINPSAGDALPLTLYESSLEAENGPTGAKDGDGDGDKEMRDSDPAGIMALRFRELPYTTESGEAEMIAMEFIREGGANAKAVDSEKRLPANSANHMPVEMDTKGKRRAVQRDSEDTDGDTYAAAGARADQDANLSKAELEYVSSLQAKTNAVRMMKSRVDLIVAYLAALPPAFIAGQQSLAEAAKSKAGGTQTIPSNNILRQILALVTNVHLMTPAEEKLGEEILVELNDVKLITLISDLIGSVNNARDVGRKFAAVEAARNQRTRQGANFNAAVGEMDPIHARSTAGDLFT